MNPSSNMSSCMDLQAPEKLPFWSAYIRKCSNGTREKSVSISALQASSAVPETSPSFWRKSGMGILSSLMRFTPFAFGLKNSFTLSCRTFSTIRKVTK